MDPRATDSEFYEKRNRGDYAKAGGFMILLAGFVAIIAWAPKKFWVGLKKAFIYITAGRHIPMPDEPDLIDGDDL